MAVCGGVIAASCRRARSALSSYLCSYSYTYLCSYETLSHVAGGVGSGEQYGGGWSWKRMGATNTASGEGGDKVDGNLLGGKENASSSTSSGENIGALNRAPDSMNVGHKQREATSTADFGFRSVPREEKAGLVGDVFSKVSGYYDLMNDLMSVGMHRLWKDMLVRRLKPFPGMQHLDVAGGTGDVALRVLREIRQAEIKSKDSKASTPVGTVTVSDINADMLEAGKRDMVSKWNRLSRKLPVPLCTQQHSPLGEDDIKWVVADAENLPFDDSTFDSYTIAFGIRNVTNVSAALDEAYRVLKPGGVFICLEFSHINNPLLARMYDYYSFNIIPAIGKFAVRDSDSYRYLVESIRKFPDQETFKDMIEDSGMRLCSYDNIMDGVIALHYGVKV